MSRFLGPIHFWLFNKIEIFEELEQAVIDRLAQSYGEKVLQIATAKQAQYGQAVRGQNLEEVIDQSNIHGWLQKRITIAETRHAAILTAIFRQYGQEAINLTKEVYAKHGTESGQNARTRPVHTAPELYKTLNDYILDGMPCDNINRLTVEEPQRVEWEHAECLHIRFWEEVSADPTIFYELRKIWIENFIPAANPAYRYTYKHADGIFHHTIAHPPL